MALIMPLETLSHMPLIAPHMVSHADLTAPIALAMSPSAPNIGAKVLS